MSEQFAVESPFQPNSELSIAALIVGFGMRGWRMLDGETEFRDRHAKAAVIADGTPASDQKASDSKV